MAARPLVHTHFGYPVILIPMVSWAAARFRRQSALTIFTIVLIQQVHAEPATIRFLSKAEAISVLTTGSGNDYYQRMQIPEIRAKTGLPLQGVSLNAARKQARAAYGAAAEEFTVTEQSVIRAEIETLQLILQSRAPRYARMSWCFIKVTPNIEGGMSYTFGDCIILPDGVVARFVRLLSSGTAIERASVDNILVHEQTHVLQRQDPALFAEFYSSVLRFRHVARTPPPDWLDLRRVTDPDAPDDSWVFSVAKDAQQRWFLPEVLLTNLEHPQMPSDFQIVALAMFERGGIWGFADQSAPSSFQSLEDLGEYSRRFPLHDLMFHPNEIMAGLLAALITGSGKLDPKHELWDKTSAWADKALR